jgi:hypothetical protein
LRQPTIFPYLMLRGLIRPGRYVEQDADYFLVAPASREFRLARPAGSVPVPAAIGITVKYVRLAIRSNPQRI